ncbi:protein STRUBBELIG-RECEPTOR FAMILY 3-like isoform X2 [Impatiens glandulifera]|nr:protein STRUBBELIG-RECEPTOR FAMILY 3-like isoform X2 [Impatiens glandulifera]XP_047317615.1 protein STRUBBELIG-RECEPTOR FAMILY 3-like isoform X2 [Impatiens glandulifera]
MSLNINQLSGEIPDSFEGLTLLVNLDLSSNNLSEHLPPSMESLSSLTTLNLQNNQISGTLDVLQDLPLLTLNVENNLFNGPVPDKLSSIPNFRIDGNALNITSPSSPLTSPNEPPTSEPSLSFWGTPSSDLTPDKQAPPKQGEGPKTPKGSDSRSSDKKSLTTKRIVWISIACLLSFIILILAILLLAPICGKRRRDDERISRHGIAPYVGSRNSPTANGTVIQESYNSEKVPIPKVAAAKSKEEDPMVQRRMSWIPKVKNEQEPSNYHGIDMSRSDIDSLAPPPPPLLKEEKTDPRRMSWNAKMRNEPETNAQRMSTVPKSDDHEIDMTIFDVDSLAPPLPVPPPARSLKPLISAKSYSIASLQLYTNSFSQENLIGGGMLGSVYRAELPSGKLLAVKKLDKRVSSQQKDEEFIDLVNNIDKFHHANVVKLTGYCAEHGEKLLIYEYCDCGTLQDILHSDDELKKELSWNTRIRMALGAARALEYLHEVCEPPVIHRNFKSSNILLDGELDAHVSDCGFAPLISAGAVRQVSGQLLSDYGYGAPEFETGGVYTMKSDVYSFGVVMLELLTGRKSYDRSRNRGEQFLARWATHQLHDIDTLSKMVDPTLNGEYPAKSLSRFADIISRCIQMEPEFRPLMSEVVQDIIEMIRRDLQ